MPRGRMGMFSFLATSYATLLINAGGSAQANNPNGTGVTILQPDRVTGSAVSGNCGGSFTYKIYFAAVFSRPFTDFGTWNGSSIIPGSTSSNGSTSGAYLVFDT